MLLTIALLYFWSKLKILLSQFISSIFSRYTKVDKEAVLGKDTESRNVIILQSTVMTLKS